MTDPVDTSSNAEVTSPPAAGLGDPAAASLPGNPSIAQSSDASVAQHSNMTPNQQPITQETSNVENPSESQPMTATSSTSSSTSVKDATTSATSGASPYGTRSRNRNGAARPNYAEDQIDVELDYNAHAVGHSTLNKPPTSSGTSTSSVQLAENGRSSGVSTRRASAAVANGNITIGSGSSASIAAKDQIPGTSSFSANPTGSVAAPPSKKRKVTGTSTVASSHNNTTNGPVGGQTVTRRASTMNGGQRETNMMSFEICQGYLKNGKLKADDGTLLGLNDHVYLICEPPGEPYYLARIMDFLHIDNDQNRPIDSLRVNWYYRPKDIQRKVTDTRVLFASMHSDSCPLTSLRGKCRILHKSEIGDIDEYRKTKDCFWYEKMHDRYIHRYYEVIPTNQVINVPTKVKRVLDVRWKFVIVEIGRGKELTSAVKSCKRCAGYCANTDSVECAVCHFTYHMNCVRPPLQKKPARGFGWSCAPCSVVHERKLEARNTPLVGEAMLEAEEEELYDEDEDDAAGCGDVGEDTSSAGIENRGGQIAVATAEQVAQAKLWPYRYLGIHCRVEDALDYDDRIYPRASSRLGPRHQANVTVWHGRPVELVKPADIKKKYIKGSSHKKDAKLSKETIAALEADKVAKEKRPPWVMDEPLGYVHRGDDIENTDPNNTAKLLFRLPEIGESSSRGGDHESDPNMNKHGVEERERLSDEYMNQARGIAKDLGVKAYSTNFLDKAVELLYASNFDIEASLKQLKNVSKRRDLREPELNKEELKRFEDGISKFGSELHSVTKHVRTQRHADIVRFYYMWKKTDKGKQIWGNYEGRKGKKEAKKVDVNAGKLVDDVADDFDDSAFDNEKAAQQKRGFECKFCATRKSRQWRRGPGIAPGTMVPADSSTKSNSKDKGNQLVLALCQRCAGLWRKYGIQWENIDEVAKKVAQGGGRAWKRRIDEELLSELVAANEAATVGASTAAAVVPTSAAVSPAPATVSVQSGQEPPKKKLKVQEKETTLTSVNGLVPDTASNSVKKKAVEKPIGQPPVPEVPKPKVLPCAVCKKMDPMGDQHLACRECRMTVHRNCYGVGEIRSANKWVCDMCSNDKNPQVSTSYECALCPVRITEHEFVEPPKISHKKKTDKEREKDRIDREVAIEAANYYRQKQEEMNRPLDPREPLKHTAGNNWVHVTCAVWTPEMRFGKARALAPSEGIGVIPSARWQQVCKICKTSDGACTACHQCHASFHIGCAHEAGYTIGFDVTPVKSSRRDLVSTVSLGNESGSMTAAIWCKEHTVKTIVHPMSELVDESGLNALQLYVRNYKQADLTLTGTVRKANLVNQSTKAITQASNASSVKRRGSTTNAVNGGQSVSGTQPSRRSSRTSPSNVMVKSEDADDDGDIHMENGINVESSAKICVTCGIDVSPKWWKVEPKLPSNTAPIRSIQPNLRVTPSMESFGTLSPNGAVNGDRPLMHLPVQQTRASAIASENADAGSAINGDLMENPAALAAAALTVHEDSSTASLIMPAKFQCHKCHWNKRLEPSPPPEASLPAHIPQHVPHDHVPHPSPHSHPHPHPPTPAQLPWAAPAPSLPPQGQFQNWPSQMPAILNGAPPTHRVNGASSPPRLNGIPPSHHYRPPPPPLPNQVNGYSPAPQQHSMPPHQLPNGVPPPYQANHASPSHQYHHAALPPHVSNGHQNGPPPPPPRMAHHSPHSSNGPLPRPGETPFSPNALGHSQLSNPFGNPHGSPHVSMLDRPSTPREPGSMGNTRSMSDGRPASGASASPSLRNLLS
ncbi:MAG: putative PHD type zinc finger protein with BAH domain-containing protein [Pycnora praestabilis]|nr:MAG: putative PHD type zinc finger protein with BAH domain-containing protein [Pycnora praestabilis]